MLIGYPRFVDSQFSRDAATLPKVRIDECDVVASCSTLTESADFSPEKLENSRRNLLLLLILWVCILGML